MVRLLVEEARDALPLPNPAQRGRDDRFLLSTSTASALPRSGFVPRPKMTMNAEVWWKTERPLSATLQQISTTSQN
jgi:hypothetical protein